MCFVTQLHSVVISFSLFFCHNDIIRVSLLQVMLVFGGGGSKAAGITGIDDCKLQKEASSDAEFACLKIKINPATISARLGVILENGADGTELHVSKSLSRIAASRPGNTATVANRLGPVWYTMLCSLPDSR